MTTSARSLGHALLFVVASAAACGSSSHPGHAGADAAAGTGAASDAPADSADDATPDVPSSAEDGAVDSAPPPKDDGADQAPSVCGPTDTMFFVDPVLGSDDDQHTGAAGCPLRTVTKALLRRAAAPVPNVPTGPAATITIVNSMATSISLTDRTGEVFPISIPADTTITAAYPDGVPPLFALPPPINVPPPGIASVFTFVGPRSRLSHVAIQCAALGSTGVAVRAGGTIDHVTVKNCATGVDQTSDPTTLGPGLVLEQNHRGLQITAGMATVLGGSGAEHTSISKNDQFAIYLHGTDRASPPAALQILGRAIAPDMPDANDVAVDGNHEGLYIDQGPVTAVLHGVHVTGNLLGMQIELPSVTNTATLELRGSFLAGNQVSALLLSANANIDGIDLGGAAPGAQGRNVFSTADQGPNVNMGGTLCVVIPAGHTLHAAGNIFRAVDCATGGTLAHAPTCSQQADIAGSASVDVGSCTITN
jgi:hypothetical protein